MAGCPLDEELEVHKVLGLRVIKRSKQKIVLTFQVRGGGQPLGVGGGGGALGNISSR